LERRYYFILFIGMVIEIMEVGRLKYYVAFFLVRALYKVV
jgi:hypothetical protein